MMIIKIDEDAYVELRQALLAGALEGRHQFYKGMIQFYKGMIQFYKGMIQSARDYSQQCDGYEHAVKDLLRSAEAVLAAVPEEKLRQEELTDEQASAIFDLLAAQATQQLSLASGTFHRTLAEGILSLSKAYTVADSQNSKMMRTDFDVLLRKAGLINRILTV